LHQNAFGGRAPPGPAGGAIALPQTPPDPLAVIKGRGRKKRVGNSREMRKEGKR